MRQSQPAAETLEHLATCSRCAKELQTLRQTIGLMRSDDVENAPANLIKYAKDMFRSRSADREPSRLARVVAALTFDSLTSKACLWTSFRSECRTATGLLNRDGRH